MEQFQELLDKYLPGNNWTDFLWFAGILLVGTLLRRPIGRMLSGWMFGIVRGISKDTHLAVQDFVTLLRRPVELLFMLVIIYVAFDLLRFPVEWGLAKKEEFGLRLILSKGFQCVSIFAVTWMLVRFIKFLALVFTKRAERTETKVDDQLVPFIKDLLIVLVVIMSGLIIVGQVFNIDIATLVAGLGIGGIAIALAAKETLENLLASFTILVDGSFVVGDAVQIGQTTGDVEKIGFRSTRIRTVDGSLVTVPNRLIVSQTLENQTQREFRRAKFALKLDVGTSAESLQKIVTEIQEAVEGHELTRRKPGIVRFEGFGDQSFDIMVIYHVETMDFRIYNHVKEALNFQILQIVRKNHVRFASPMSTIRLRTDVNLPGTDLPGSAGTTLTS